MEMIQSHTSMSNVSIIDDWNGKLAVSLQLKLIIIASLLIECLTHWPNCCCDRSAQFSHSVGEYSHSTSMQRQYKWNSLLKSIWYVLHSRPSVHHSSIFVSVFPSFHFPRWTHFHFHIFLRWIYTGTAKLFHFSFPIIVVSATANKWFQYSHFQSCFVTNLLLHIIIIIILVATYLFQFSVRTQKHTLLPWLAWRCKQLHFIPSCLPLSTNCAAFK